MRRECARLGIVVKRGGRWVTVQEMRSELAAVQRMQLGAFMARGGGVPTAGGGVPTAGASSADSSRLRSYDDWSRDKLRGECKRLGIAVKRHGRFLSVGGMRSKLASLERMRAFMGRGGGSRVGGGGEEANYGAARTSHGPVADAVLQGESARGAVGDGVGQEACRDARVRGRVCTGGVRLARKRRARWLRDRRAEKARAREKYASELKGRLQEKYKSELRQGLREKYEKELKDTLRKKYGSTLKGRLRRKYALELKEPLREKYALELKEPLREKYASDLKEPLREKYASDLKEPLREKYVSELKEPLREKYVSELKEPLQLKYESKLRLPLRERYKSTLKHGLKKKYEEGLKERLQEKYKSDLKQGLREKYEKELKDTLRRKYASGLKGRLRQKYVSVLKEPLRERYALELKETLRDRYVSELKEPLRKKYAAKLKESLRQKYDSKLRLPLRQKYKTHLRQGLKEKYEKELKERLQEKYKSDLKQGLREKYEKELKDRLREKYASRLKERLKVKYALRLQRGLKVKYESTLKESLREKYVSELKEGLRGKYKSELRQGLKEKYANELKDTLREKYVSKLKGRLRVMYALRLQRVLRGKYASKLKGPLRDKYVSGLQERLRAKYKSELKQGLKEKYENELKEWLQEKYKSDLKRGLKVKYEKELKDTLREKYASRLKGRLRVKYALRLQRGLKVKYASVLKGVLREKYVSQLKESLQGEYALKLKEPLRQKYLSELKEPLREKYAGKLKEPLREKYRSELRLPLRQKYKSTLRPGLQKKYVEELKERLQEKYKSDLKQGLREKYEKELKDTLREKYASRLKGRLKEKYALKLKGVLKVKYELKLKGLLQEKYVSELKERLQAKYKSELKQGLREKYEKELRDTLREKYVSRLKGRLRVMYALRLQMVLKGKYASKLKGALREKYVSGLKERLQAKYKSELKQGLKEKYDKELKERLQEKYALELKEPLQEKFHCELKERRRKSVARVVGKKAGERGQGVCTRTVTFEAGMEEAEKTWPKTDTGDVRPPSFAMLDSPEFLTLAREFQSALGSACFETCACCAKAWFGVVADQKFASCGYTRADGRVEKEPWFSMAGSAVLEKFAFAVGSASAQEFGWEAWPWAGELKHCVECVCGAVGEAVGGMAACAVCRDVRRKRRLVVCRDCAEDLRGGRLASRRGLAVDPVYEHRADGAWTSTSAEDVGEVVLAEGAVDEVGGVRVLGRRLEDFAPAIAALSDFEEMVLSLVHPLVQVYTIPRTGELAYVGHICNFRQDVTGFMTKLPARPRETPFVMVRPRRSKGAQDGRARAPFRVSVVALREAFEWLREHNPYYQVVEWDDGAAGEWEQDDVDLPTREGPEDLEHEVVQRRTLERWLEKGAASVDSGGDDSWAGARRVMHILEEASEDLTSGCWFPLLRWLAARRQQDWVRHAQTLTTLDLVAVLLLAGDEEEDADELYARLRSLQPDEWPDEADLVVGEIVAVRLEEMSADDVTDVGVVEDLPPGDERGDREAAATALVAAVLKEAPSGGSDLLFGPAGGDCAREATEASARGDCAHEAASGGDCAHESTAGGDCAGSASGEREATGSGGDANKQKGGRGGQKYPRVNAPALGRGPALPENTPGYIVRAFPKLFPHGVGDYHTLGSGRRPLFIDWGRHVLQWHDGRFMRHSRFRYWLLNTWLRMRSPGVKDVFYRVNPHARDLTVEQLQDKRRLRTLVQQMTTASGQLPGTFGEVRQMRQRLEALVEQKEAETMEFQGSARHGRIPSGFTTFSVAVYKWAQLHELLLRSYDAEQRKALTAWQALPRGEEREKERTRAYYKLAVGNPGAVAWYCALRLEMMVKAACALVSLQLQSDRIPGKEGAAVSLEQELRRQFRDEDGDADVVDDVSVEVPADWGRVDDYWASFEWSAGGMVHVHVALWIVGSPRIDGVYTCDEKASEEEVMEKLGGDVGDVHLDDESAARVLSRFFNRLYTEWHIGKDAGGRNAKDLGRRREVGKTGLQGGRAPDMLTEAAQQYLLGHPVDNVDAVVEELEDTFVGTRFEAAWREQEPDVRRQLPSCVAAVRLAYVGLLAEWCQMHDWHEPYAAGPPGKHQSCAKVDDEYSSKERVQCGKLFPRSLVRPGGGVVSEDPRRRALYRLWLPRNCSYLNNFVPALLVLCGSNMDFQAVTTKFGVVEYMTKYLSKSGQGSLVHVMEEAFWRCVNKDDGEVRSVGAAISRFFNLAAAQEVKSQLETMHLLFGLPRYLCSREFSRMAVRAETKRLVAATQVTDEVLKEGKLTRKSALEVYASRDRFEAPGPDIMRSLHPATGTPLWRVVRDAVSEEKLDSAAERSAEPPSEMEWRLLWPKYMRSISWWQFARAFRQERGCLRMRPRPDVAIVAPFPRLRQAQPGTQFEEAVRVALIAFAPWPHRETFDSVKELDEMPADAVVDILARFVSYTATERSVLGVCECPAHVRKQFVARMARDSKAANAKRPVQVVAEDLRQMSGAVVQVKAASGWRGTRVEDMSQELLEDARRCWKAADCAEAVGWLGMGRGWIWREREEGVGTGRGGGGRGIHSEKRRVPVHR